MKRLLVSLGLSVLILITSMAIMVLLSTWFSFLENTIAFALTFALLVQVGTDIAHKAIRRK